MGTLICQGDGGFAQITGDIALAFPRAMAQEGSGQPVYPS